VLISARLVHPRKPRRCDNCGGMIVTSALRLYGACDEGDKPYVIWTHPDCTEWSHPKIQKAKGLPT